jgi:uncharacterized membrane protein
MDQNIIDFIHKVSIVIINPLIRLVFLVALVVFIWGVFGYVKNGDSDEARSTGRRHMIWGVFGMFIMISVFAIMAFVLNTFDIPGATGNQINQVIPLR